MSLKSILLLTAAFCSANAFVVSSARPQFGVTPMTIGGKCEETSTMLFSTTKLQYRNQDEEDSLYTDSTTVLDSALKVSYPETRPAFLPRKEKRRAEQMMDAEMVLGRIAMIASSVAIVAEVVTGTSLPEQITNFLS